MVRVNNVSFARRDPLVITLTLTVSNKWFWTVAATEGNEPWPALFTIFFAYIVFLFCSGKLLIRNHIHELVQDIFSVIYDMTIFLFRVWRNPAVWKRRNHQAHFKARRRHHRKIVGETEGSFPKVMEVTNSNAVIIKPQIERFLLIFWFFFEIKRSIFLQKFVKNNSATMFSIRC